MKIRSTNPANGQLNAELELMNAGQAQSVCRDAHDAFTSWKALDVTERAEYLVKLAAVLRKNKADYARLMAIEMGKPVTQGMAEVEKSAWTAEVYAQNAANWLEDQPLEADGIRHLVNYEPMGAILCIMPWNFPFWQALRFAIPAMSAGNTVVLRHSNAVPLCAQAIGRAFETAGFPAGTFGVVLTDHDTTASLIASPDIAGISLTGSEGAGKHVGKLAAASLKKCVLELGGSDPFIVMEDADVHKAAKSAAQSRLLNSGQSCVAAKRFIVSEKIAPEFTDAFVEAMKSMLMGDPMDEKTQVGPLANVAQRDTLEAQVNDAVQKKAKVLCGGVRREPGAYYEPTVLSGVNASMRVWSEEVFGPVAPIHPFLHIDQAVQLGNHNELGLGASVWSESAETAQHVARRLECGMVFINSLVKSDPRLPFGGVKKSGIGRELGKWGLREFCNVKAVNVYNP